MEQEEPIMRYFEFAHLQGDLRLVSEQISIVAKAMHDVLPRSAEKTAGLRKLLEAKDCFVRASLPAK